MKISLLKLEDLYGENCLSIFKKISPVAEITDIVRQNRDEKEYCYCLDSYSVRNASSVGARLVLVCLSKLHSDCIGVRLKVSLDDIENEIIKDAWNEEFYVVEEQNGVKTVLALEWPQNFAIGEDKQNLELLEQYGKLKSAKRCFEVFSDKEQEAVYYKDSKYVKINGKWVRVEPIEWYYAEKEQVLVSKKILFCCPMLKESGLVNKDFCYEKSIVSKILQEKFLKQAIMDPEEKALYHFPISPFYDDYRDELQEINFWRNFLEKREKRKENLKRVKTMTAREFSWELPRIIEEILTLNEEDEKYLKEYVIPYYCQK